MVDANNKVLIVDDDAGVRMGLSRALSAKGYDAREASSGSEAMSAIKDEFFNLALVDEWESEKNKLGEPIQLSITGSDAVTAVIEKMYTLKIGDRPPAVKRINAT